MACQRPAEVEDGADVERRAQDGHVDVPPDHQAEGDAARLDRAPDGLEARQQVEFDEDGRGLGLEGGFLRE